MIQIENKSREKLIKKNKITKNKITEKINIVEKEKDGLSNEVKCLQDQKYIDAVINEESKEIKEKILEKIIKTSELKNESRLLDEEIYRAKVHLAKLHARNFPRLAFDYLK
ncbi:MAG: hypothetical protein MHPSP_001317 [Paramarteilia canceri]